MVSLSLSFFSFKLLTGHLEEGGRRDCGGGAIYNSRGLIWIVLMRLADVSGRRFFSLYVRPRLIDRTASRPSQMQNIVQRTESGDEI